jgi:ABC-type glycerol-3-phosphate transport system substrate-binding protein
MRAVSFVLVLIVALISANLVGCSTPPPTPTALLPTSTVLATRPAATPSPLPATATPVPTASNVTVTAITSTIAARPLVIWAIAPREQQAAVTQVITETAQLQGISVIVAAKSADALAADLAAGDLAQLDPPDLIWGDADDLFLLYRLNRLQAAPDELNPDAIIPAAIIGSTAEGQRYGTPLGLRGFFLLLYNRNLVDSPPRTVDDLIVQARQQVRGGRVGLVAAWVESRWLEPWLQGLGSASIGDDGTPTLNTPAMLEALAILKSLRSAGPPPPSTYAAGAERFREGTAAFAIDGDWALSEYRSYTETLDLGIAPLPSINGRPALAPLEGVYLMYGKQLQGDDLDQAKILGQALASEATQRIITTRLGYLPIWRDLLHDPVVQSDPARAAAAQTALAAPGIPPLNGQRCAWEVGEGILPLFLLGDIDAEEAAARMQERALLRCQPA